jgi:hypothetical protein
VPDAAHRFVAEIDASIYRNQLSDEQAIYLLVQLARDVCIERSLDWSALMNHMQGFRDWHGHRNYATLANEPAKGQFFKVWSMKRAKESR